MRRLLSILGLLLVPLTLSAQTTTPESQPESPPDAAPEPGANTQSGATDEGTAEARMTLDRLDRIIRALDPDTQTNGTVWQLTINEVRVLIVTDADADRMRAITPVTGTEDVTPEQMQRMLQANFDTALDARYAIANDVLWSAFIHPLGPLEKDQLISGLGQVVNLAQSYGTLYSGGALQYGGGDSGALQRQLIDDLLKKGEDA